MMRLFIRLPLHPSKAPPTAKCLQRFDLLFDYNKHNHLRRLQMIKIHLIRSLSFLGILGVSLFTYPIFMEVKKDVYSVWALPPEELRPRLKALMEGLRSEFGGPQFEPHVTVVGAISLTESEARDRVTKACERLEAYDASVEKVATGTFFYQCVFLLLHPTPQVVEASAHCCSSFGYKNSTPYMPHLSLLYGDRTEEEKKTAREKAYILDESIGSLNFKITHLALYKTDTEDKSCKTWEKVAECELRN